jgi:hypothetical protein
MSGNGHASYRSFQDQAKGKTTTKIWQDHTIDFSDEKTEGRLQVKRRLSRVRLFSEMIKIENVDIYNRNIFG